MANRRAGRRNFPAAAFAVAATLVLAGCGTDGVELNGKLFDWMGVGANSTTARNEPQLAQRAPLVPPPSLNKLPEPGSVQAPPPTATATNWPGQNERDKQALNAAEDRKKQEYCSNGGDWKSKTFGAQSNEKPPYDCPNVLTSLTGWFKKPANPSANAEASLQGAKPVPATAQGLEPDPPTDSSWSTTAKPAKK